MADRYEHAQFTTFQLLSARGPDSTVSQALTHYWNWAADRGWKLVAVVNQPLHGSMLVVAIPTPDVMWDVVWRSEEPIRPVSDYFTQTEE